MKYMGDYPSKRFRQTTDLTDAIFEPALLLVSIRHRFPTYRTCLYQEGDFIVTLVA